jgi:hypothetical protein
VFDLASELLGPHECWAAVVDRIRGGHIRALARSSTSSKEDDRAWVKPDPFLIPHDLWRDWIDEARLARTIASTLSRSSRHAARRCGTMSQ